MFKAEFSYRLEAVHSYQSTFVNTIAPSSLTRQVVRVRDPAEFGVCCKSHKTLFSEFSLETLWADPDAANTNYSERNRQRTPQTLDLLPRKQNFFEQTQNASCARSDYDWFASLAELEQVKSLRWEICENFDFKSPNQLGRLIYCRFQAED